MSLVDWSEIDPEWKWITGDRTGVTAWVDKPLVTSYLSNSSSMYTSYGRHLVISTNPVPMFIEQRPTEGDPT